MHYIRTAREAVDPHALKAWIGRAQRRAIDYQAVILLQENRLPVKLTNISYEGCRFDCAAEVHVGDCFALIVPGLGEIAVKVCWSDGASVGVAFFDDRQVPQSH